MSDETPDTTGLREAGDVEALAGELCRYDDSLHHQDGTDDFPCWHCTAKARDVLASDWLANHVAAAREADRAEVERLRAEHEALLSVHDVNKTLLTTTARADRERKAAEERLAGLVAKIEAEAHRLLAEDPHYTPRTDGIEALRDAILTADAATALDAVREKAKAEERERIAQAIEAHLERPYTADYRDGLCGAARIARHTPEDGA